MKRFLSLPASLLISSVAVAQTSTIVGTVQDAKTHRPLPGANVVLSEVLRGAATEIDGTFAISPVRAGVYTLRVSFVGFKTHEERIVVATDTLRLNVALTPDFARYDEVVVTGMATERSKATADVAVARLNAREYLDNNDYGNFDQLLTGKISGLTVQPSTGNVAGGARLILRTLTGLNGPHQPTVYVDGVRIDAFVFPHFTVGGQAVSVLSQLNPNDIESIDVLKGPAGAALYGTSGSDGVILVTTSKGSFRSPVTVDYRYVFGENRQADEYDLFTASTPDAANAIFRTGAIDQHSLEVRGGSETMRFLTSYEKRREDGQIRNDAQDRNSFRANLEAVPSAKFRLNANTFYLRNDVYRPPNDDNIYGYLYNVIVNPSPYESADSAAIENLVNLSQISRFIGGVDLTANPLQRITLHVGVGYDGTEVREDNDLPAGYRLGTNTLGRRRARFTATNQTTYQLDGRIYYRLMSDLTGSTTAGVQAFDRDQGGYTVEKNNFPTTVTTTLQAASDFTGAGEYDSNERELGIFVTEELNFRDQLFVTLGLRRDYASAIGVDAPSILYPRASIAVRLDRLLTLRHVNLLKVRMAYGQAGQLPDPLDPIPILWDARSSVRGAGAVVSGLGNPEIKPERIAELELGLEASVFADRLTFDGTYYRQRATNSIFGLPYPPSSGLTIDLPPFNIGSAKGSGVETSVSGTPIYSRDYDLDVNVMWQWQSNKVTSLGGAPTPGSGTVIREGLPYGAYYSWTSRAKFNPDGSYAGAEISTPDLDGDGSPDLVYLGTPYPRQNGSALVSFRFLRNFHLSVLADWQLGQELAYLDDALRVLNSTHTLRNIALVQIGKEPDPCKVHLCDIRGTLLSELEDYDVTAQEVGSEAYRAAAETVARTEFVYGNFIRDADFFKLREVSIRYDFTDVIRRSSIGRFVRSAGFTLAGRNLFTSSRFPGMDPEASSRGAFSVSRESILNLPQPRILYGMFSIGF